MRAVQIDRPGGDLRLVELETSSPAPGHAQVRVEACGVCHTDDNVARGVFGSRAFPLTPGHEIAGLVEVLGEGVEGFAVGDRVAVGWFGGNCGHCQECRAGDLANCAYRQYPGLSYRGGHAERVTVPVSALARVPAQLDSVAAAPLTCAGSTVYNGLRSAAKMGFETVAIARGQDKKALAGELGALHYIDSTAQDVTQALRQLGGARMVLATVTQASAMNPAVDGLRARGTLVVAGASPDRLAVTPAQLIRGEKGIRGAAAGTASEIEATMRFAALTGVRPMTEAVPLAGASAAFARMLSGKARFRMVLTPDAA
jgi:alcohol dehydrogenase